MKKIFIVFFISLFCSVLAFSGHFFSKNEKTVSNSISNCEWKGIKLYGKVQFVDAFPDIKVQFVDAFPDIKVQFVDAFPNDCGKWQEVTAFPDFKVQVVTAFPDIKVQKVTAFPGVR